MSSEESLYSLAKRCVEDAKWDTELAVEAMVKEVQSHKEWMRDIIERGCRSYVASVASNRRGALSAGLDTERGGTIGSSAVRRAFQASVLDTYVVLGRPLRVATADKLRESIAFHKTTAASHVKHAEFEARVLRAMGASRKAKEGSTVGDCLREDQVSELLKRYNLAAAA
ncbi:MAG: hypothetical protein ACP5P4_15145 [Steroidobacteraceae bacterium]